MHRTQGSAAGDRRKGRIAGLPCLHSLALDGRGLHRPLLGRHSLHGLLNGLLPATEVRALLVGQGQSDAGMRLSRDGTVRPFVLAVQRLEGMRRATVRHVRLPFETG